MYRYTPPKSNIWGHSLGKLAPSRQKALFEEFLTKAVAAHTPSGGSLTLFAGPAPEFLPPNMQEMYGHVTGDDVRHFEQLLGTASSQGAFSSLTPQQSTLALAELLQRPALLPGSMFSQSYDISSWLIDGQPVPTKSMIILYYGMKPCLSTFLEFETTSHFEFIKRTLSDLNFCKLNEKHLKPEKQGTKKK